MIVTYNLPLYHYFSKDCPLVPLKTNQIKLSAITNLPKIINAEAVSGKCSVKKMFYSQEKICVRASFLIKSQLCFPVSFPKVLRTSFFYKVPPVVSSANKRTKKIYDALQRRIYPSNIYLFRINNTNTRERCEVSSKLTIKAPMLAG